MDKDNTKGATALANRFKGYEPTQYSFKGKKIWCCVGHSDDNWKDKIGEYVSALKKHWGPSCKAMAGEIRLIEDHANPDKISDDIMNKVPIQSIVFEYIEDDKHEDSKTQAQFCFLISPNSLLRDGKKFTQVDLIFINGSNGTYDWKRNWNTAKPSDARITVRAIDFNSEWKIMSQLK